MLSFRSKDKKAGINSTDRVSASFARVGDKMIEVDPVTKKPITNAESVEPYPQSPTTVVGGVANNPSYADGGTHSVVEKSQATPPSPTVPVDTAGGPSGQNSSSEAAAANVDVGQKVEHADPAFVTEDKPKTIPIDEEYIRKLYSAVEGNSKQIVEMIGSFNALVDMIQELNAGTVDLLGKKSAQLEAVNAELELHKIEEAERLKSIDRLFRENSKLKDKCEEYVIAIVDKDEQIERVTNDLKAVQEKCDAKDAEIGELNKSRQDAEVAHAEKMAEMKNTHASELTAKDAAFKTEITNLVKKHFEEVEALNKNAADQLEAVRTGVSEFVPTEVCDLFDYRIGEPVDDRSRWQAIYAYLGFINGNLRSEVFVRRFREFDAAFYDAMRDTPEVLAECRVRVQRHINEELGKKTGAILVCWPKVGDVCNPDQYTTTSDFGQCISEVIGAMIYKKADDGKVLCMSKGKVATA